MNFKDVETAVNETRTAQMAVDAQAGAMARLLVGRLRNLDPNWQNGRALKALKRELRDFDSRKGWFKE